MSDIADRIREKREREGLSLRDAGSASGVAFSTLGRIEAGKTPSLAVHQRIVAWLDGAAPIMPPPPMSLRDWFAGQALPGLIAGYATAYGSPSAASAEIVREAFSFADAMLTERQLRAGRGL